MTIELNVGSENLVIKKLIIMIFFWIFNDIQENHLKFENKIGLIFLVKKILSRHQGIFNLKLVDKYIQTKKDSYIID